MATTPRSITLSIDGLWTPMDLARLMHLVVRFYRLEQIAWLAATGQRNLFDGRLDAVVLKHLAAFDWIAAPLMSAQFNDSYDRSEDFVREFGLNDPRIESLSYIPPGHVAFRGAAPIMDRLHETFAAVVDLHGEKSAVARDAQGKFSALEVMYVKNVKAKAELMRHAGYSDAELNAIVSPSIEDLHFLSNAVTQGRIVAVEKRSPAR